MHGFDVGLGFFDTGVDEEAAIDAGGGCVVAKTIQAVTEDGVQIGEEEERDFGTRTDFAGDVEDGGESGSGFERTLAGALDHGAIGDGVAEGDAQLDEISAAAD